MGLRTIQVLGKAYSETGDVSINAVVNGTTVFNGTVPTVNSPASTHSVLYPYDTVLFQFDVSDTMYSIVVPSTFVVTNGTAFVAGPV